VSDRLLVGIRKGLALPSPQFVTPGPLTSKYDAAGYYATTGVGPDLMDGTRAAIRAMIEHLVRTYRLSRPDVPETDPRGDRATGPGILAVSRRRVIKSLRGRRLPPACRWWPGCRARGRWWCRHR